VPKAPTEPDWIQLIGDEPVLILLDELPPYFEYAQTRQVGGGTLAQVVTFALSNLLAAALKLPRCCIVISSLSGTYPDRDRPAATGHPQLRARGQSSGAHAHAGRPG
jgi:hypothetical protein